MPAVCTDTGPLLWMLEGTARANPDELARAQAFADLLLQLQREGAAIIVPRVVAAELLTKYDDDERLRMLKDLAERFDLAEFDDLTVLRAAEINANRAARDAHRQADPVNSTRQRYKIDVLVVATAKARRCRLLTSDGPMAALAKDVGVAVIDNPLPNEFGSLFFNPSDGVKPAAPPPTE